jgi:hypothetical protein
MLHQQQQHGSSSLQLQIQQRRDSPTSSPTSSPHSPPRISVDELDLKLSSPTSQQQQSSSPSSSQAISIHNSPSKHHHLLSHLPKSPKSPNSPSSRGYAIGGDQSNGTSSLSATNHRIDWAKSPARKKLKFTMTNSPSALTSLIQNENRNVSSSSTTTPTSPAEESYNVIPRFYFPKKKDMDRLSNIKKNIRLIFAENNDILNYHAFEPVCRELEIPEIYARVFFLADEKKLLTYTEFEKFVTIISIVLYQV